MGAGFLPAPVFLSFVLSAGGGDFCSPATGKKRPPRPGVPFYSAKKEPKRALSGGREFMCYA